MSAVMELGRLLERTRVFTPLGIRFWDAALDVPVVDALRVQAWSLDMDVPPTLALRSPSGVYGFHGLPGLRDVEYPKKDMQPEALPQIADFAITVEDPLARFLPMLFVVALPLSYRGEFLSTGWSSPPFERARAYLFSAPTRVLPDTLVSIRADVWDLDRDREASYAALRAELEGETYVGVADEQGRVLLTFAHPPLEQLQLGSPPGSGQLAARETSWPLTVRVAHEPLAPSPLHNRVDAPTLWRTTPSIKSILTDQEPAPIWESEYGPASEVFSATLLFGEPLILRTDGRAPDGRLWIHGSSPP